MDRVFTGDTLLIGATGRTDLPTGEAEALYDSLFAHLLRLDETFKVYPAHEYKGRSHSTIAQELKENPRLQKRDRTAFVEMMHNLNLSMPTHITEALRTNMSGGKTVAQMLAEAAAVVPFMSLAELKARIEGGGVTWSFSMCASATLMKRAISRERASCRAASSSCAPARICPTRPSASLPTANSAESRRSRPQRCVKWAFSGQSRWTAA